MKTLNNYIQEKLVIGKNTKSSMNDNNDFWDTFNEYFVELSNDRNWKTFTDMSNPELKRILRLPEHEYRHLNMLYTAMQQDFYDICYMGIRSESDCEKFYDMMKFVLNKKLDLFYDMTLERNGLDYYIKSFVSNGALFTIIGPERVTNMSEPGHIIYTVIEDK